jgi:hypothetical protein
MITNLIILNILYRNTKPYIDKNNRIYRIKFIIFHICPLREKLKFLLLKSILQIAIFL